MLSPDLVKTRASVDGGPWSLWSSARGLRLPHIAFGSHTLRVQARTALAGPEWLERTLDFDVEAGLIKHPAFLIPVALLLLSLAEIGRAHV